MAAELDELFASHGKPDNNIAAAEAPSKPVPIASPRSAAHFSAQSRETSICLCDDPTKRCAMKKCLGRVLWR